jgi:hypothetical protein
MNEHRRYWTTGELAEAASVSEGWIRKLLRSGEKVDGFKAGRDWLVPDDEARRWLRSRGVKVERD